EGRARAGAGGGGGPPKRGARVIGGRRPHARAPRLWLRESAERPVVVVVEDLHWLDAESEAFLVEFAATATTGRVLLLANARPEYREAWRATRLRLEPLPRIDAQALVGALVGERGALLPLRDLVLARAEGNPLFIEEIVQALVEQEVVERRTRADVRLPASVQEVLAARIDRLDPPAKALLQTFAVVGRTVRVDVAREIAGEPDERLRTRLAA